MSQMQAIRVPKYLKRWLPYLSNQSFWLLVSLYQNNYLKNQVYRPNSFSVQTSLGRLSRWSGLSKSTLKKMIDNKASFFDMVVKENKFKSDSKYIDANKYSIEIKLTPYDTKRIIDFLIDQSLETSFEEALEKLQKQIQYLVSNPSQRISQFADSYSIRKIIITIANLHAHSLSQFDLNEKIIEIENSLFEPYQLIPFNLIEIVKQYGTSYGTVVYFIRSCGFANYKTLEFREKIFFEKSYQGISDQTGIPVSTIKNLLSKNKNHIEYLKSGNFKINFMAIDDIEAIAESKEIKEEIENQTQTVLEGTIQIDKNTTVIPTICTKNNPPVDFPVKNTEGDVLIQNPIPKLTNMSVDIPTKSTEPDQLKKQIKLIKNKKPIKHIQGSNNDSQGSKNLITEFVCVDMDKIVEIGKINYSLNQIWEQILLELSKEFHPVTFENYIQNTKLVDYVDNTFLIQTDQSFKKEWLEQRLSAICINKLSKLVQQDIYARFIWQPIFIQQQTESRLVNQAEPICNQDNNKSIDKYSCVELNNHQTPTKTIQFLKRVKTNLISEYYGYKQTFVSKFDIQILLAYRLYLATDQGKSVGYGWLIRELERGMPFLESSYGKRCYQLAQNPSLLEERLINYLQQGPLVDDDDPFSYLYRVGKGLETKEEFDSIISGSYEDLKNLLNSIFEKDIILEFCS